MSFRSISRPGAPLACLSLVALLALTACGGGSDPDEVTRADVVAARTARGQAARGATGEGAAPALVAPAVTAWVPQVSDTWQWQLTGTINTKYNAKVYDIDLFDAPDSVIATLHSQGKYVVCYFSAGSAENWRPDYNLFKASDKGNNLDGWAGEKWVDTRSANVRNIMKGRLDKAKARSCDGVEPDNVDGYTNNPGFPLTASTQLDYNRFLANEARARGLKVGLKNDVDQLKALEPSFDFAVNEQCNQYSECGGYSVFTNNGKPVFNAEYKKVWRDDATARAQMCAKAKAMNLRTLVLPLALNDAYRYSCD
ncbi:endo alpha-1,4 polygalactosaminidase [Ideonella sp.]|uniref:endo alpha-1,4 polygalactosaminidase n=1 Tax=Ideonella sp. TaxID=1929293 RepID=UPI0035AD97B2